MVKLSSGGRRGAGRIQSVLRSAGGRAAHLQQARRGGEGGRGLRCCPPNGPAAAPSQWAGRRTRPGGKQARSPLSLPSGPSRSTKELKNGRLCQAFVKKNELAGTRHTFGVVEGRTGGKPVSPPTGAGKLRRIPKADLRPGSGAGQRRAGGRARDAAGLWVGLAWAEERILCLTRLPPRKPTSHYNTHVRTTETAPERHFTPDDPHPSPTSLVRLLNPSAQPPIFTSPFPSHSPPLSARAANHAGVDTRGKIECRLCWEGTAAKIEPRSGWWWNRAAGGGEVLPAGRSARLGQGRGTGQAEGGQNRQVTPTQTAEGGSADSCSPSLLTDHSMKINFANPAYVDLHSLGLRVGWVCRTNL